MEIKADVRKIEELKSYFFSVPDYQREYVWQADIHVSRFLEDINDAFQPENTLQSSYFIGSTIILKNQKGNFDIIDGQQRFTTIIITLCAIRNVLARDTPSDQGEKTRRNEFLKVVQELLYKYDTNSDQYIARLTLQYEESKDFLVKLIKGEDYVDVQTPSIVRMQDAYNTVLAFLSTYSDKNIINFVRYFLNHVELVMITPDSFGSALKIFETINERGVGLNAMDLLKNLLFSHTNSEEFGTVKQIWKEMFSFIDSSGEGDNPLRFLRYFLIGRYHNGVLREDQVYQWLTSPEGIQNVGYKANPTKFANELRLAAKRYARFIKATVSKNADDEYPNITGIGYLGGKTSRQHLVLLMALKDGLGNDIINLLSRNIESLLFYFAANRYLTKYYEEKFASWAILLRQVNSVSDLQTFLNGDFNIQLTEQQAKFNAEFNSKSETDFGPLYRVKYIFGTIDNFVRKKTFLIVNDFAFYQRQQIEHILPQIGINVPQDLYPNEFDYYNTVRRLGNLTLLEGPINQSLNNCIFCLC